MNMKKTLAGVMAVAMTVTMLPGSMFAAPEKVEAKTVTSSLPEAKYEMDLDGNLNVTGDSDVSVATYAKAYSQYSGGAKYVSDRDGQVLDTEGAYGIKLENVQLGSTYTISAWVNLQSAKDNSPVISASNPGSTDNWLTLAGGNTTEYKLWTDSNFSEWGGQSELGRISYKQNQWVNYVLSVDGESAVLYENGNMVINGTNVGVAINSNEKYITFGVNSWDDVPDALYDDIKIYDEALSAEQVQALDSGTAVELSSSVSSGDIRIGDTAEITANIIGGQAGDTVEWSSNSECVSMNDGVVTAVSEGTATITANVMRNGDTIATGSIDINVYPEKGRLIAEFTFDEDAAEFHGAGAVAKKADPDDKTHVSVVKDDTYGNVLRLNNEPNAEVGNWLEVTKDDESKSSLLSGIQEFTVSYDSLNEGLFNNSWTFFADQPGVRADARNYLAIAERTDDPVNPLQVERKGFNFGAGSTNGWKHVDVVFGEYNTEIYVDGELRGSFTSTSSVTECLGEDSFVYIGHATWPVSTATGENLGHEYWKGYLDNYKIYDYALTAEEIASTPVSNIEVTADPSTVFAGNTLQLAATVVPMNATDKTVEWTSSDPEVAEVNENGLVTTKKAGNVTITATAQDKDGKSGSIDLTVKAALTYHEAKDPTCAEPGNIEYWTDAEGNLYKDEAGTEPISDVIIPATGNHEYAVTWNWVKTDESYTATATFICKVCQEKSEPVDAEITSQTAGDITTYTAKVVYNEREYTTSKEVANNYTLIVEGGTITSGQKDIYSYADKVTVTADESKDGKYFSGWYLGDTLVSQKQVYTFYVLGNMSVTAKYEGGSVIEEQPVLSLRMEQRQAVGEKEKLPMIVEWSLPAGYRLIEAGVVRSYDSSEILTLENVDGTDVRKNTSSLQTVNGSCTVNLNMSATTKLKSVYACGYLIYEDSTGIRTTIYTDKVTSEPSN